jgi:hypothetical protein
MPRGRTTAVSILLILTPQSQNVSLNASCTCRGGAACVNCLYVGSGPRIGARTEDVVDLDVVCPVEEVEDLEQAFNLRPAADRELASHPSSAGRDWNRSFETKQATIRGGALLIHGLTDSPYSMRAIADVLSESGVYSLALRMPGHGTLLS